MWHIDTMEYCSAIKKSKIMMFSGEWMTLGNTMLSNTEPERQMLHAFLFMDPTSQYLNETI